jgi:ribosome-interacting GTPase 1
VKEVLREHGYVNATVTIREPLDVDRLVDAIMDNRVYLPSVVCVNKADLVEGDYAATVREELRDQDLDPDEVTFVSAETGDGLDILQERIWEALGLMRIYMKKPGRGVDREEPLIVRQGATIDDAMDRLGGDFDDRFRFGRVTGPSAAHEEQQVGRDHELADEDVLELVLRR